MYTIILALFNIEMQETHHIAIKFYLILIPDHNSSLWHIKTKATVDQIFNYQKGS